MREVSEILLVLEREIDYIKEHTPGDKIAKLGEVIKRFDKTNDAIEIPATTQTFLKALPSRSFQDKTPEQLHKQVGVELERIVEALREVGDDVEASASRLGKFWKDRAEALKDAWSWVSDGKAEAVELRHLWEEFSITAPGQDGGSLCVRVK